MKHLIILAALILGACAKKTEPYPIPAYAGDWKAVSVPVSNSCPAIAGIPFSLFTKFEMSNELKDTEYDYDGGTKQMVWYKSGTVLSVTFTDDRHAVVTFASVCNVNYVRN